MSDSSKNNKQKYNIEVGAKIGSWTVLSVEGMYRLCKCSCGVEKLVQAYSLQGGGSMSCVPCMRKRRADEKYTHFVKAYSALTQSGASKEVKKSIISRIAKIPNGSEFYIARIDPRLDWSEVNFYLSEDKNTQQFRSDSGVYDEPPSFVAKITRDGKRIAKSFSVKTYGFEQAKKLATEMRKKWEDEIVLENIKKAINQGTISYEEARLYYSNYSIDFYGKFNLDEAFAELGLI